MTPKFVISDKPMETIKEAENKANSWYGAGQFDKKMRLYKVVEEYRPHIKYVKVKQWKPTK